MTNLGLSVANISEWVVTAFRTVAGSLFLLTISVAAMGETVVRHEGWLCCGEGSAFEEVVAFARRKAEGLPGPYSSVRILSPRSEMAHGTASSSHEDIASSFRIASRLRARESHAYFLQTPIGVSVHHWDARTMEYKRQVLSGRDAFDMQFRWGRLAWIRNYKDRLPEFWLVSDRRLEITEAEEFVREVMKELRAEAGMAYIRTDPYAWPKEGGWPYSLPLQWRSPLPADADGLSRSTIFCDLSVPGSKGLCRAEERR